MGRCSSPPASWEHRVTLLPGGTLHITNMSQADVDTYRCVAHSVASTRHSQEAQLPLSGDRPINVEGVQVLGARNLFSAVSVRHSGVCVRAANRPGTRGRRTGQGDPLVQAPPSLSSDHSPLSKPLGSSAIFTCVAQGVRAPAGSVEERKGSWVLGRTFG
ncbi:Immunoglobulin superfamily DCC subclass member 3 [Pteropus alecto]|nr:Immunoglobulin superfamily DCC subclass member 3 [Pteropus alecto]